MLKNIVLKIKKILFSLGLLKENPPGVSLEALNGRNKLIRDIYKKTQADNNADSEVCAECGKACTDDDSVFDLDTNRTLCNACWDKQCQS